MKSIYCKIVLVLALIASYFLLPPDVFVGSNKILAFIFMIVFSFSVACIIRNIKEKFALSRTYKTSVFSLVLTILGFSAFQVCGVGAPICGATVGMGVLSVIFPGIFVNFLTNYSIKIIYFSILLQLFGLYFMKCFSHHPGKCSPPKEVSEEEQY